MVSYENYGADYQIYESRQAEGGKKIKNPNPICCGIRTEYVDSAEPWWNLIETFECLECCVFEIVSEYDFESTPTCPTCGERHDC